MGCGPVRYIVWQLLRSISAYWDVPPAMRRGVCRIASFSGWVGGGFHAMNQSVSEAVLKDVGTTENYGKNVEIKTLNTPRGSHKAVLRTVARRSPAWVAGFLYCVPGCLIALSGQSGKECGSVFVLSDNVSFCSFWSVLDFMRFCLPFKLVC